MREGSVDDLARRLAAPMPRRRALRLLGAAAAIVALPTGLRAAKAAAAGERPPQKRNAGVSPSGRDLRAIGPTGPYGPRIPCGDAICDPTSNCVKCCIDQLSGLPGGCCPCYVTCQPNALCGEQTACPPDGRPFCGKKGTCCAPNEFCFKGSVCVPECEAGETLCEGRCCPKGAECVNVRFRPGGPLTRTCLPKCPGGRTRCGLTCCNKKGHKCINPDTGVCSPCDAGQQPCGRKCCAKGSRCCDSRTGLCCKSATQTCAGYEGVAKCCPKGTRACTPGAGGGKPICCPKGQACAQVADESGTVPSALLGKRVCCPEQRAVAFGGGTVTCCPPGYRSLGGRFVLPAGGGGGLCCRDDKLCGAAGSETCCGTNADPGIDQTCCNGTCTSLFFDEGNCGSCGNVCPAGTQCIGGACVVA